VSNALRARRQAAVTPATAADLAELTSIGVDPEGGGRGIGSALVEAFVAAARDAGAGGVRLTTDRDDNAEVNAFYRRRGFALHATYEAAAGRFMNEYRRLV
jgi:ribosomal protein S18 acetylase RimI-like enzyme